MLLQIDKVPKIWSISRWDAVVWIITFTTTVVVSVDIGLVCGIAISITSLLVRGFKAYTCILGVYPNTDLYLDVKRYTGVSVLSLMTLNVSRLKICFIYRCKKSLV